MKTITRLFLSLTLVAFSMAVMGQGGDHASGHTTTRRDFAGQYANLPKHWTHELGVVREGHLYIHPHPIFYGVPGRKP